VTPPTALDLLVVAARGTASYFERGTMQTTIEEDLFLDGCMEILLTKCFLLHCDRVSVLRLFVLAPTEFLYGDVPQLAKVCEVSCSQRTQTF
jgi:hypothetical protein